MSELKRPEKYVEFESIKPKFKDLVEFYTNKSQEYRKKILEFSEYADGLEKEISILKDNPQIEILLDNTDKQLVVVPEITQKQADTLSDYKNGSNSLLEYLRVEVKKKDYNRFARAWIDGYTVEKDKKYILKHIDMSKLYTDVSLYLAHGLYKELEHIFYKDVNVHNVEQCHFTQKEIDKLNIGSYEQIEVEP